MAFFEVLCKNRQILFESTSGRIYHKVLACS